MKRKIITIDKEKCNGCGLCVTACHEGAIAMVEGKAELLCDDYCDGLGDCLPACPIDALSFEEREALAYDEVAVKKHKAKKQQDTFSCNSFAADLREPAKDAVVQKQSEALDNFCTQQSELLQWPIQIKLVPLQAPYFNNADLLVAADCTAYAYGSFHERFMRERITLIGCPKLDEGEYAEKLTEILIQNTIQSVTVVRMEVPCCGGLESAVATALKKSGKMIPFQVVILSTDGKIRKTR